MTNKILVFTILLGILIFSFGTFSQMDAFAAVDSKGKEFVITFIPNYSGSRNVQLHISSETAATVNIKYPVNSPTFTDTVNVSPGTITIVDLPVQASGGWNAGTIQNNAVLVESSQEVTVYTTNLQYATSDAALAIPSDASSFKYIVTAWTGSNREFSIAAISDNTKVTIYPQGSLTGGYAAGVSFDLSLNRGEGFLGTSGSDLTGSIITADKPITMTNGNQCTNIAPGGACDHIYEHGIPVQGWGKSALVGDLPARPSGSPYFVTASEDNTNIFLDGSKVATISEGGYYNTGLLAGNHEISADKPIFTTKFMTGGGQTTGDPAMANIIPPEQFLNKYTFATTGGDTFVRHFVALTVANSDINSIKFDGAAVDPNIFTAIGTSGFSYGLIDPITEGTHTTSSTNGHGILVGGFGYYDSYLYPGGAAFEFINPQPEDDRDGDGVPDINDACPDEYAETDDGCPITCQEGEAFNAFYDFNGEGVPSEFSYPDDPQIGNDGQTSVAGFDQYGFDGQFLRNTSSDDPTNEHYSSIPLESIKLTLTGLPEHDTLDIEFLLAIIDSWDSDDSGTQYSPDYFNVKVDGNLVFNSTHNNQLGSHDYGDINPDTVLVRGEHIGFTEGWSDSAYDLGKEASLKGIPHTGSNATIEWTASGSGWQGGNDESFAIDNVKVSANNSCEVTVKPPQKHNSGNQWDKRPTFAISHEDRYSQVVENGFRFNNEQFTLTDNHWTPFEEQSIEVGTTNTFAATVYADKRLKVQEFLFGIPNVGESQLAELGVEVWYDYDGNIEDVKVVQKSNVIDADTISVSHDKVKCLSTETETKCDNTTVSMKFLEPLKDKVMAIKAIDFKNRDQRTYLNEGFDISGKSLNPMESKMIPSNIRDAGLLQITQVEKYSPYWTSEDGRMFEMNSFGSFKEINQKFERFQDTGDARTRLHSGFEGIIDYEKNRATKVFDASVLISELPDSFGHHIVIPDRITPEMKQSMLQQEQIAKETLDQLDKQNRYY